jgi:ribonuclease Z
MSHQPHDHGKQFLNETTVTSSSASIATRISREPIMKIVGAWTKAGIASCVQVQVPSSKLDILLDCGACDPSTFTAQKVFISHGHMDHAGACFNHARAKALCHQPSTYYIPSTIKDAFLLAKQGFEMMDNHEIPMNIVEVNPGDEITLTSELKVKVFATEHRVPSQGYIFFSTKRRLLPEYQGLPSSEIGALKRKGIEILSPPEDLLELVYTGDTTFHGLLNSPCREMIFHAPTLITELTYLNGKQENAEKYKHIHIEDVRQHENVFQNQQVVFVHLSQKYSVSQAIELLNSQLSREFLSRVLVNLHSFGAAEPLTRPLAKPPKRPMPGWGWSNAGYQEVSYRDEHVLSQNIPDQEFHFNPEFSYQSGGGRGHYGGRGRHNQRHPSPRGRGRGRGGYTQQGKRF